MEPLLKKKTSKRENQLLVATVLLLIALGINITTVVSVLNRPIQAVVVHKADNATVLHGKITGKEMIGKLYTIDCGPYGKFLVSKEQYDAVNVGDDIPSYLRGEEANEQTTTKEMGNEKRLKNL